MARNNKKRLPFKSELIKPFLKLDKDQGKVFLGFDMQQYRYLQLEKHNTNDEIVASIDVQFRVLTSDFISEFSRFLKEVSSGISSLPKLEIIDDKPCEVRAINGNVKIPSS